MQDYAKTFYKSKAWQACRESYLKQKHGLCEQCMKRGIYRAGEIVHHKIHLTPTNIHDPSIALSWDNLELLCREHHAEAHKRNRRYRVDAFGKVIITE